MNTIYILIIIAITLVTNASLSFAMPYMKAQWKTFITRIKRKLNAPSKTDIRLDEFDKQLNNLSKKITNINNNNRDLIKKTVREYLNELKNK